MHRRGVVHIHGERVPPRATWVRVGVRVSGRVRVSPSRVFPRVDEPFKYASMAVAAVAVFLFAANCFHSCSAHCASSSPPLVK